MPAVRPPLSSARDLGDFDFGIDIDIDIHFDADGALELDGRPSSQGTRVETPRPETLHGAPPARRSGRLARVTPPPMARVTPPPMARVTPPPMAAVAPARRSSSSMVAVDPHDALIAFSGFGAPPTSLLAMPAYAVRVIARRRILRRELELARRRGSHDVGIYEASLRTADDGAVRSGMLLMAALFTLMTLLMWTGVRFASGTLVVPW